MFPTGKQMGGTEMPIRNAANNHVTGWPEMSIGAQKQGAREPTPAFPAPEIPGARVCLEPSAVAGAGNSMSSFRTLIAARGCSIWRIF